MYEVTIAIPVYNVEKQIERSLLSALNQSFGSIEFLVVDDKGTDNSMIIVERIKNEHPRGKDIKILDHQVNRGLGATRNSAIENAQGRFIFFMDSDDVITPDCISLLYKKAIQYNLDVIGSSHSICNQNLQVEKNIRLGDFYRYNLSLSDFVYKYGGPWLVYTWNKLYNLDFLRRNKIHCIPYHLCEDIYFTHQVRMKAKSFAITKDITYYYVVNPASIMGKGFNNKLLKMCLEAIDMRIKDIKLNNYSNSNAIYGTIINAVLGHIGDIYKSCVISEEERNEWIRRFVTEVQDNIKICDFPEIDVFHSACNLFIETGDLKPLLRLHFPPKIESKKYLRRVQLSKVGALFMDSIKGIH